MTGELDGDLLLRAADQIARPIVDGAVWHGGRCNWVGAMPEEALGGRMTMSFLALGADLYGGSSGVGLFLAELARATGDGDTRRTALGALRHAISRVEDIPPQLGLYAGRPGVALALALAARATGEGELDEAARTIAATIAREAPGRESDLMSGSAGAIVGLLALRELHDDDALLAAANAHGDALVAAAERTDDGRLSWRSPALPGVPGLTGYSHGAAGVAVALLELAAATRAEEYREAAGGAFAYERALYNPAARNWPDLRNLVPGQGPSDAICATFWCHGAPGGALARLRALELGGDRVLREEASAAIATTETWVAAALAGGGVNFSLCHGLAGNAEILLEGASLRPGAGALAERVAAHGVNSYLEHEQPWPSGAHGGDTPSLFLGLAGIGRFYLRLATPALPSLLLVRPGPH